jgi:hypothetical protein
MTGLRGLPLLAALLLAAPPLAAQSEAVAAAPGAELRLLDKVANEVEDISLDAGASYSSGRLTITLTECRYPVDDPASDAFAFLTIHDSLLPGTVPVFQGWMIASSPALSALDHARYDVWVLRCTTS